VERREKGFVGSCSLTLKRRDERERRGNMGVGGIEGVERERERERSFSILLSVSSSLLVGRCERFGQVGFWGKFCLNFEI